MSRLPIEELFRVGPDGLEPISDVTLELRIAEAEHREIRKACPESTLSQIEPLEAV